MTGGATLVVLEIKKSRTSIEIVKSVNGRALRDYGGAMSENGNRPGPRAPRQDRFVDVAAIVDAFRSAAGLDRHQFRRDLDAYVDQHTDPMA